MLSLDDKRWDGLCGGYGTQFDPRPALSKIESGDGAEGAWRELWNELHHQGDIGDASYASVPHIVRIYRQRNSDTWNALALVAVIELARTTGKNPDVPSWLREEYFQALQELSKLGCINLGHTNDKDDVRAILSVIAIAKNARTHAKFLLDYSEDELREIEGRASGTIPRSQV
jgi:hypothetical protein